MTFGTEQKRFLLRRWKDCYTHRQPSGVTVYIRDAMCDVKFKADSIKTVQEYIDRHILDKVRKVLNSTTMPITHYYMLLDKGAPLAKRLFAHTKRKRKGVVPLADPTKYPFVLPTDGMFSVDWPSLLANRAMTRREVFPLYTRAVMEVLVPNEGQFVILDGAPVRPLTKESYETIPDAFDQVFFTHMMPKQSQPQMMSNREILNTPMPSRPRLIRGVEPTYRHNIMEADLSAFYYVNKQLTTEREPGNPPPDILIDSNDGDSVLIALLQARDRISPQTGKFRQRLWIMLKGQKRTRDAYAKRKKKALDGGKVWEEDPIDGRDVYININKLFILMTRDRDLRKAQNPVLMAVVLFIFSGTDFFDNYHEDDFALFFGMGGKGWEKYIFNTWCRHAERFSHMIMMFYAGTALQGQPDLIRTPHIDEDAILMFIYQCYAARYGTQVRKNNNGQCTINLLRQHCECFRLNCVKRIGEDEDSWKKRYLQAKKKRIPPQFGLRRYIRLMLLNVKYWNNDNKPGGPESHNVLEKHEGLPYYGFIEREDRPGYYTLAPVCSNPKPAPIYYTRHFGRHRSAGGVQVKIEPGAAEASRKRETEKAERAAERASRRKKLKIKRERERELISGMTDAAGLPGIPKENKRTRRV